MTVITNTETGTALGDYLRSPGSDATDLRQGIHAAGAVSVFKFLTIAQVGQVLARSFASDLSSAIQSAVDSEDVVYFPAGGYRIDSEVVLPPTASFFMYGDQARTEIRAGAAMGSMFRKATLADGANIEPIFIADMRLNANRNADRCIWVARGKKGGFANLILDNFLVEAFKGGDDTGSFTASFYENEFSHIVIDGGIDNSGSTATMPLYGINLTENATDNVLTDIPIGYVSEAGLRAVGGGNISFGVHAYGSNSSDTGPKYAVIAGAFGQHDAVYADNVTVAGVKVAGDSVRIGPMMAYWASDNVPTSGGARDAVPIEVNSGVNSFLSGGGMIRNGNSANPAIRILGSFWPREFSTAPWAGAHTPQASPRMPGAAFVMESFAVHGRSSRDSFVSVESQSASLRAQYRWRVNSNLRYDLGTNAAGESGGNAGSNMIWRSYADDGSTPSVIGTHYRSSNQWDWDAKHKFKSSVFFGLAANLNPSANGEMTFALASDTSLVVKAKGSDGIIRQATLTLA